MAILDLSKMPQALGQNTPRIDLATGKPLRPALDNEAFINEVVRSSLQALDEVVFEVQGDVTEALALGNQATAFGRMRLVAGTASGTDVAARWNVELEIDVGTDVWAQTGLYLDLMTDGTSRFSVIANQFRAIDPGFMGGEPTTIFDYVAPYFRFGVPVVLDTGELLTNAVTHLAASTGTISGSSLSVTKSFYGGTDAKIDINLEPVSGLAPVANSANVVTQRTYPVALDFGTPFNSLTAYDVCIGSNDIDVRNAIGTSTEKVVDSLYFYPGTCSKPILYPSVPSGSHTFSVFEPYGLPMVATMSVTEFKR